MVEVRPPSRRLRSKNAVLATLCMAILLDALDLSITQVSLPSIAADLDIPLGLLPWIANAYVLTYGGLLLLGGRLNDLLGRRRVFLLGLALFGATSLVAGLVRNVAPLIAARAVQGTGAALTVPAAVAILAATFEQGAERNRALGVFAAFAGTGFSVGLVAGGALTESLGWPWVFLIKVPVVVGVMLATVAVIDPGPPPVRDRHFDLAGALSSTVGLLLLAVAVTLVAAPSRRWWLVCASAAGAAALLVSFWRYERLVDDPLLPLTLLANRTVAVANLGSLTVLAAPFGFAYLTSTYLQGVAGFSPLRTGLAVLPGAVVSALVSRWVAPTMVRALGVRVSAAGALVTVAVGFAALALVDEGPSYLTVVLPACIICLGLGMGLAYPLFTIAALTDVSEPEQGLAAGLQNAALQIGGGLGLAAVSAVLDFSSRGSSEPASLTSAVAHAALAGAVIPLLGAAVALAFPSHGPTEPSVHSSPPETPTGQGNRS